MNYQKIYNDLINRAKERIPEGYVERHHIIPRCMGGSDEKENLVALYPEEHFLAHALLLKINLNTQYRGSLAQAVAMMCVSSKKTTKRMNRRLYGWLKRERSLAIREAQSGEGNSQFGTMWICNITTKENKKISKETPLPEGWVKGRNLWVVRVRKRPPPKPKVIKEKRPKKFQCLGCGKDIFANSFRKYCDYKCAPKRPPPKHSTLGMGKKCYCDGLLYQTLSDAAKHYNISVEAIRYRLNSDNFKDWFYVES